MQTEITKVGYEDLLSDKLAALKNQDTHFYLKTKLSLRTSRASEAICQVPADFSSLFFAEI